MVIHNAILTGSIIMQAPPVISGSLTLTGSITSTGPITGSGFFTAGTITAQTLVVQTITSSVSSITGSTKFGSLVTNTHQFTGSMFVTGALYVTTGSVGIGTILPSSILHIVDTSTNDTTLTIGQAGEVPTIKAGGANTDLRIEAVGSGGYLDLVTNATSSIRITSTGKVGIGTTNPTQLLVVSDNNTNGTSVNIVNTSAGGYNWNIFSVGSAATIGPVGSLAFRDSNNGVTRMLISSGGNVGIGTGASIPSTLLHVNTARTSGANVDIMTLSDNVTGIQTSGFGVRILATSNNGQAKSAIAFEANGGTNNDTAIAFYTQTSAASLDRRMTIDKNGAVGIGTADPSGTRLRVEGGELRVTTTNLGAALYRSGNTGEIAAYDWGGAAWVPLGYAALSHSWKVSGTEAMRITSGGIIYALNTGVDGTYQPMIGGMYSSNNNETNLISTAVSSVAAQSGFRFDVSNGAGSSARTTSMTINRSSVSIVGSLSKGSGSFRIKHPLLSKKDTHHLVHSFIEGPQADLIYSGGVTLVDGKATINIDEAATMTEGTFEALCRNIRVFTSNETSWDNVRGKVVGNILTIECQNTESTDEVSWLVIGERQDEHMIDTEWTDENGKVIVEPLIPVIPETTL